MAEMPTVRQLGRDHIACYDHHAVGPGTPSSTSGLMQSRQPVNHDGYGMQLSPDRTTLAEQVANAGIATAGWHANGFLTEQYGFPRGFEEWTDFDAHSENNNSESLRTRLSEIANGLGIQNHARRVFDVFVQAGIASADPQADMEKLADAVLEDLSQDERQFLYLHPMDVHMPYIPPANYRQQDVEELYNIWSTLTHSPEDLTIEEVSVARRAYRNEARYVDDQIANLIKNLKDSNQWDQTALIVSADHGELFRNRSTPREHSLKHINYLCEELTHVPFVVAGGRIPDVAVTNPTSTVDVAPTVTHLFGVTAATKWSGIPILDNQVENRNAVASSTMHSHGRGIEVMPDKLHIAVRSDERTLLWWADDTPTEYCKRTIAGEVPVNVTDNEAEREHAIRCDIEDTATSLNKDAEIGGDVTERLRDLGYVEGDDY